MDRSWENAQIEADRVWQQALVALKWAPENTNEAEST
jgi:hypothetical protein